MQALRMRGPSPARPLRPELWGGWHYTLIAGVLGVGVLVGVIDTLVEIIGVLAAIGMLLDGELVKVEITSELVGIGAIVLHGCSWG